MIGRSPTEGRSLGEINPIKAAPQAPQRDMAVNWGVGCLVGAAALVGVVLLVALVAFAVQPPAWVQIVIGVVLALGAVLLTWLVATAWGRRSQHDRVGR
jgi:Flp pilus assembly protein TadB